VFQAASGVLPVLDIETNQLRWIHAGQSGYMRQLSEHFRQLDTRMEQFCLRNQIGYVSVNTQEDYLPVLEAFFRSRNRNRRPV
jgi:hypothetical protein